MLLKTRFYIPPLRKQSVIRHHLIDSLCQSSGGELVIVSGPAGYGKTTLISQWLHTHPHTFSWLTIDPSSASPCILWHHIINALQNIQPGLGEQAQHQLTALENSPLDEGGLEHVIIALLNDLDALCTNNNTNEPMTLVLDDFHHIHSAPSNTIALHSFNVFLDHLPPSLRLVLTTRNAPALSLPRRRANNQLVEISEHDLAFDFAEGKQFLNDTMRLSLNDADIRELSHRSEGWIVGLQLVALSMQKNPSMSAESLEHDALNKHISDYLFEEVFALQPIALQQFLVVSACVPKFCAGLCNHLLTVQNSLPMIAQLDQLNLFLVPLDNHGTWYRYHDLFRQFLLNQFSTKTQKEQRMSRTLAATWFEDAGYIEAAIEQWIAVENWQNCARLLNQLRDVNGISSTNHHHLDKWLVQLPDNVQKAFKFSPPPLFDTPTEPPPVSSLLPADNSLLTSRESQVLHLVSQGLANKQIASTLNISLNTLKVHIRNLYGKLGVENRTQAVLKITQKD